VFSERYDTNTMSFPCLAHLSFHLHDGRLCQQAIYRNEYLVGRAYGNYLGLSQLQGYIARACGLGVGEFVVTVGHVELDGRRGAVRDMLDSFTGLL
jgi:thymidylate synthase